MTNSATFPRTPISQERAQRISDALTNLALPHSVIVDVHGDSQNGGAPADIARRIRVRKSRLKPYWIHRLEEIAEKQRVHLLLNDGQMEFR